MLTEEPLSEPPEGFVHDEKQGITQLSFKPFQIITLKATLKS